MTGASGFVGSHLVQALVDADARVTAVVATIGWRPTVPDLASRGQVRICILDRAHPQGWEELAGELGDVEAVAHLDYVLPTATTLAGRAEHELAVNAAGAVRLAGALSSTVRRLCFASSAMVYGAAPPVPVREDQPTQPATPYAVGKVAAEQSLALWAASTGVGLTALRYATVFGPQETAPRAIPNFIRSALVGRPSVIRGDGSELRDYVHVTDVARATVAALSDFDSGSAVVNVGSGTGRTTVAVAQRVACLSGNNEPAVHEAADPVPTRTVCDTDQARRLLGFVADIDFDAGLRQEIDWFSANPHRWESARVRAGWEK